METLGITSLGTVSYSDIFAGTSEKKQIDITVGKVDSAEAGTGTAGVHTLTLTTLGTAGDKIVINGVDYEFVASTTAGKAVIGADTTVSATNLTALLNANTAIAAVFTVTASTNTILFTQKTKGVGAIPSVSVTKGASGTLVASIATTTAGVSASDAISAGQTLKRGCLLEVGADGEYYAWAGTATISGVLGSDTTTTSGDEPAIMYVVGEFRKSALTAKSGVTIPSGSLNYGNIIIREL